MTTPLSVFFWDSDIQTAYRRKEDEICAVSQLPKTMRLFVETNYPGTRFVNFGPSCGMGGGCMIWHLWGWNQHPLPGQTGTSHVDWQTSINGVIEEQITPSG